MELKGDNWIMGSFVLHSHQEVLEKTRDYLGTDRIRARCGRSAQAGAALLRALGPPEGHLRSHARASHAKAEIRMGPWRGTCAAILAWICAR